MIGITIIKKDEYAEKTISIIKENIAELIFSNDDIEVIRYHMPKGIHGIFDALDIKDNTESYTILSGKILISPFNNPSHILDAGDTMIISKSNHSCPFQVLKDTVFICNTSNNNSFHQKKQQVEELCLIMDELNEKDSSTKEHCIRVQNLSMEIARESNISDAKLNDLFHAARFHDIGKINIPTDILLKPEPLTAKEKEIICTHPYESYKMVYKVFGEDIGKMVLQHHERLDGSGYPHKLKGDEICLEAKVIAVADVYDALTSKRPYRPALSPQKAIEILLSDCGTHYDPICIKALINYLKKEKIISIDIN